MPTRHLAGARAVKVLAVALAIYALGSASRLGAQGFESDINTIQTDLRDAYQRDFFIYHNDLFPGFLLHTKERSIGLFRQLASVGLSAPTWIAWSEGGRARVAQAPATITGTLTAPWLIVWFNGASGWDQARFIRGPWNQSERFNPVVGPIDCPWLIVLQHPAAVTLDAKGLTLDSVTSLEHVVMMPLFGSEKLNPQKTAGWASQLPEDLVQRANQWVRFSRRFPLYAQEDYQIDEARDEVHIRNRFEYLTIEDDWKTEPAVLAPVSPVTALAYTSGFRISFDTNPRDLQMVTHWGPLLAVLDRDTYEYTLTGILKYVDEEQVVSRARTNVPGFEDARRLLIARIESAAAGGADPRGAYSVDWGMGMISAWMRATRYVPEGLARRLTEYIRKQDLIAGHFFNAANYNEVSLSLGARTLAIPVFKASKGQQTYGDDLVKQTSRMPYVAWQYGYYSGDWSTIQARYDFIKRMYGFNLLLGWSNVGPEYTAEHAKISAKQGAIGLSRLARRFGDQPTYDYGVYLLAKALINEWAWTKAAVPYATSHSPWFHPTDTEWIAHENHGYAGIEGMPLDQVRTYQEIPLVLDRFNREELADFNDFYVRMRHRYAPNEDLGNVYVTDFGDAPDLASLFAKPLTDLVRSPALRRQSHVSPIYYNYPIDLMELASEMTFERIHPKGGPPEWRRGLDALSRGQSWRQLAIALRTDWKDRLPAQWPYPGWYLMNPPKPGGRFHNDLLPFGFIEADERVPYDHKIVRSNWNSELASMKLSNRSAQLPITMLLALTGAAGIWGCVRLRKFVRKSQVRLGVLN
jgi:hypothetical protein